MIATRRDILGASVWSLAACTPAAPETLHTITIRPRMSEAEFRAAAGDRLRPDDSLEMSAFTRPYRLVYAGCEPPLVVIDANDREAETMFTSPRLGIHLTVLKPFLTAEEVVAEGERVFQALTSSSFATEGARFRVFLKRDGETTPLPNPEAVVDYLRAAPRDTLERISSFHVSHPDGRSATATFDQGAALLMSPQNRFRMVLYIGDELILPAYP